MKTKIEPIVLAIFVVNLRTNKKIDFMKHYLNKFQNQSAYSTARADKQNFNRPAVSLIDSTHDVIFDPLPWVFKPRYLYSDLTTSANLDSSKTVIGVEVIPANHEPDRKARFMSVKNMSRSNPESGTTDTGNNDSNDGACISWGNGQEQPINTVFTRQFSHCLDIDNSAVSEDNPLGLLNQLSSSTTEYLVSDYDNGVQFNDYPFFEGGAYLNITPDPSGGYKGTNTIPYPFNNDGTKNLLYWNNGEDMAITDMSGFGKTATLINHIEIDDWQTGALNNTVSNQSSERRNYPAAAACYRFNPASSNTAHQWYLPSAGELGYLMANIVKINAKIDALPNGQGIKLGVADTQIAPTDDLGFVLASSTEHHGDGEIESKNNVVALNTKFCAFGNNSIISGFSKTGTFNGNTRVRAFIAI